MVDAGDGRLESVAAGIQFRYRLGDAAAPVVYLVHGRAGNDQVMWAFARTIPSNWTIIAPQAPYPDPVGGFSWWLIESTAAADGAAAAWEEKLSPFVTEVEQQLQLTVRRRLAFGFSQGAGLLSVSLQRSPQLFAGIALLAGFVVRSEALSAARPFPSVFVAHGTVDDVVPIAKSREGIEFLRALGCSVVSVEDPVAHKIGTQAMRSLTQWTAGFGA